MGFLQFEGTKLVNKFTSLVYTDHKVSYFLQKLTGIKQEMVRKAPKWSQVKLDLLELEEHTLIAHNANFEQSFLTACFDELGDEAPSFADSMPFLAVVCPEQKSLGLEALIKQFKVRDSEIHRGFEDSLDMLKVILIAVSLLKRKQAHYLNLIGAATQLDLKNWFFFKFLSLDQGQLNEIAEQVDFDLAAHVDMLLAPHQTEDLLNEEGKQVELEFSGENIKKLLREKAKLNVDSFEYRQVQEELALKVGQCFKNDVHALIQAPTGTGKTIGYLLPSILFAKSLDKQVLVATGTKTLQEQVLNKDIPHVRRLLNMSEQDMKVTSLVGSGNHLCELLYRREQNEDLLLATKTFNEKLTALYFESLFFHNLESKYPDKLTKIDVPYVLKRILGPSFEEAETNYAVDFRACTGRKCPYKKGCSYLQGLREAKESQIIIGNHSLMFTWPKSLNRPENIIIDEAHRIEHEASSAYCSSVSGAELALLQKNLSTLNGVGALFFLLGQKREDATELINQLKGEVQSGAEIMAEHLSGLGDMVELLFKKSPQYSDKFWNELPMVSKQGPGDTLAKSIYNHFESIFFILQNIYKSLSVYEAMWDMQSLEDDTEIVAFTKFESFVSQLAEVHEALKLGLERAPGYVHSMKFLEGVGYELESTPINVGEFVHENVLKLTKSVVCTSATLANADGTEGKHTIEWVTGYNYLDPARRFKSAFFLPTIFEVQKNSKVYLCDDMGPIFNSEYVPKLMDQIIPIIRELGGRTLLLFSAKTRFELAREILLERLDFEIPVFAQGINRSVVEDFKASAHGVLIGMESFGEGIDVPGDSLQFIFIDKIPDLRRDLVTEARRNFYDREFGNEFNGYFMAKRAQSLHQKLGRLLRSTSDRGAIVVADSRIGRWKPRTLNTFYNLMKPYKIERAKMHDACADVVEFINP